MVIDTSAIMAILKEEPEAERFALAMESADSISISAASWLETSIVVSGLQNPRINARLEDLLAEANVVVEPFTAEQARLARDAYRNYGKGSGHRANLNFGDCFSYALARDKRQPLLYKGEDFLYTDLHRPV